MPMTSLGDHGMGAELYEGGREPSRRGRESWSGAEMINTRRPSIDCMFTFALLAMLGMNTDFER